MKFTEGPNRIPDQGDPARVGDLVSLGDSRCVIKYEVIKEYYPQALYHQAEKEKKRVVSAHAFAAYLVEKGFLKPTLH